MAVTGAARSRLVSLRVRNLGVIADLSLDLGAGLTAITGETGAGKTLVVEAIELLVGGRADAGLVRPGEAEAAVEGVFEVDGGELILARTFTVATNRSRARVDGDLVPMGALAERGDGLVDLHGQHAHQSLLAGATQRAALDAFGAVDLAPLAAARGRVTELLRALAELGGDERSRARETDLLRYQLAELGAAGLADPDEDAVLAREEEGLADATAHREAAAAAHEIMAGDGGVLDGLGAVLSLVQGRTPLADLESRLRGLQADASEATLDLRTVGERLEDDPERLEAVRRRRQVLREVRRKYGDTLAGAMAFADQAAARLAELEGHDARAATLDDDLTRARARLVEEQAAVGRARRAAAPLLAAAVQNRLVELAMPNARLEVTVGEVDPGDDVTFLLGANAGEPALPLARTASGGELARAMLATRLVLSGAGGEDAVGTLVFDEVDAGIGGEAALAVGRALAALGRHHQVLVVTHLAQVAAFADTHVQVRKREVGGRVKATAAVLDGEQRLVELSRMLSGQPGSAVARAHADELLRLAGGLRREGAA
jgi:DNA repair protein RecN (Recombination protein N)